MCIFKQFILDALNWLKVNNPLYNNITIDVNNISANLTSFEQHDNSNSTTDFSTRESTLTDTNEQHRTDDDDNEERDDPLNEHRQVANETCLQSVLPDYPVTIQSNKNCALGNEVYNIAPGENRHPISIMRDIKCEELAFPVLFPKGRFGYIDERKIKLI